MRIYAAMPVAELYRDAATPDSVWGVTDALRASMGAETLSEEDYESEAMALAVAAASECVSASPACRIVVAADVADVAERGSAPGALALDAPLNWDDVVSIHIDEEDAWPLVARASEADEDDPIHEELAETPLLWYDATELGLVRQILERAE